VGFKELHNEKYLLLQVADGSHRAFRELFDAYNSKLYNYAFKIIQSEMLAEEAVQEVFMKIWINRAHLDQIDNFGGYIRVMARNQTLQILKRLALESHCLTMNNKDWTELHKETENHINYNDTKRLLDKAVNTLPPQQKLIYTLCRLEGMKHKEVASRLSISHLTVKAHLRQAVHTVKTLLLNSIF
jgi:RNA polymerase sigma-70 factor (ECF subfamily)